jgi:hypothetical protein
MLVDELLFACREPGDIERQRRQTTVKLPKLRSWKNAQDDSVSLR